MKKIIVLLILSITCITVYAQIDAKSVYAKKSGDDIYYRVIKDNHKSKYYHAHNAKDMSLDHIKFSNQSYQSYYDNILVTPVLLYGEPDSLAEQEVKQKLTGTTDANGASLDPAAYLSNLTQEYGDDRSVVAMVNSSEAITTSSDFEVGRNYDLLKVVCTYDSTLNGCPISCQVITRRKSNILGSEGRLVIRPRYIIRKDGTKQLLIQTDIVRRGLNRSNVKFWLSWLIIPLFVPGTGAAIAPSEMIELRLEK